MPLIRPPKYSPTLDQIMDRLLGNLEPKTRKHILRTINKETLTNIHDSLKAGTHWKQENLDPINKKGFVTEFFPAPVADKNLIIAVQKLVGEHKAKEAIEIGYYLPVIYHIAKHLGKKVVGICVLGTLKHSYKVVDKNPNLSALGPLFESAFRNQYIFAGINFLKPDTNEPVYYLSQEDIINVKEFKTLYKAQDIGVENFSKDWGLRRFSNIFDSIDAFVTYYLRITRNKASTPILGEFNVNLLSDPIVEKELARVWEIIEITPEEFSTHYGNIKKILELA